MSQLPECSTQSPNSSSANSGSVDSSTRTCRVGGTEVQDSFEPSSPTSLPSPSEMRAFRAGVGAATSGSGSVSGTDVSLVTLQFHPSVWDAFGAKSSSLAVAQASSPAVSDPKPAPAFCHQLWYAQSSVGELHHKKAQLSFNAIRIRPTAAAV
jgi:hypothetical protein